MMNVFPQSPSVHDEFVSPESSRWRDMLGHFTHDVYHLPEYLQLGARQELGEAIAFLVEDGENRFFLPLIIRAIPANMGGKARMFDALSPYGYPCPLVSYASDQPDEQRMFYTRAIELLIVRLRARGVVSAFLRLHPLFKSPFDVMQSFGTLVHHGDTVVIDLTLSDEELWHQTRSGHRNEINRAKRHGCTVEMDVAWTEFAAFQEMYRETMRRVGAHEFYYFSDDYFRNLKVKLAGHLHMCVVRCSGQVVCAALFTEVCGIVQYFLSGTRGEYLQQHPTKLMLHYVRHWAKERGNRVIHLGGGIGSRLDSLFEFKAGFSKIHQPFHTWRIIVDEEEYGRLAAAWEARTGLKADDRQGFFPTYRN